jgi:hypothetical protein
MKRTFAMLLTVVSLFVLAIPATATAQNADKFHVFGYFAKNDVGVLLGTEPGVLGNPQWNTYTTGELWGNVPMVVRRYVRSGYIQSVDMWFDGPGCTGTAHIRQADINILMVESPVQSFQTLWASSWSPKAVAGTKMVSYRPATRLAGFSNPKQGEKDLCAILDTKTPNEFLPGIWMSALTKLTVQTDPGLGANWGKFNGPLQVKGL